MRFRPCFVLLFALAGCGLSDYEGRMDAQRARVQFLDEENRNLGDVIERPFFIAQDQKQPFWPFDVFLRLPQGISGAVKDNSQFVGDNLSLFRYGGAEGYNVFVAAGGIYEPARDGKEAKIEAGEWPKPAFRNNVREALRDYYRKQYKVDLPMPDFNKLSAYAVEPKDETGKPLPKIGYEAVRFTDQNNPTIKDHSEFRVYFHEQPGKQVAVIYQFPVSRSTDQALNAALDWSLKSLDISPAADFKRQQFKKRRR